VSRRTSAYRQVLRDDQWPELADSEPAGSNRGQGLGTKASTLLAIVDSGPLKYLAEPFRHQAIATMLPASYDFDRIMARELWKRGVPLVVGTDAPIPGVTCGSSVPEEMIELNKIGLAPRY
jgi:hypothetical protein